jgi:tetratricopeptide (TPR) repeat protein
LSKGYNLVAVYFRKEGIMNPENLEKLIEKAREMATGNIWEESAFKINMKILKIDSNNSAAYTRLAKYYKLHNNLTGAKKMYIKALEIDPNSQGARNNLDKIDIYFQQKEFVDQIPTSKESYAAGQSMAQKGKYGLAVKCFLKAYSIDPLLKYGISLAKTYWKLGKYEKVETLHKELLEKNTSEDAIEAINIGFAALLKDKKKYLVI